MDNDPIKSTAKDIACQVQEQAGKAIGSKEQQAKGLQKQVEAGAEKRASDVKEVLEDVKDMLQDAKESTKEVLKDAKEAIKGVFGKS